MDFVTKHIRGAGRGKGLGFATINLEIPKRLRLKTGIYAVWIYIGNDKYPGACHYGPIPSFGEKENSLEVHIVDKNFQTDTGLIEAKIGIEVVGRIREVINFKDIECLRAQIREDSLQVLKMTAA